MGDPLERGEGVPKLSPAELPHPFAKAASEASRLLTRARGETSPQAELRSTPRASMTEKQEKPSAVEEIKGSSCFLRGAIPQELVDGNPNFGKDSIQLIKHFGTYEQDNRDTRKEARAAGRGKDYIFMVRTKLPGGKLTSAQLLAELDLCDEVGNTTLRITSRQGLQLHGVVKDNLKHVIKRINDVQLSTLGACGDVNRNVMCCPGVHRNNPIHDQMQALADELAEHFAPRTSAYHELWLTDTTTGEKTLEGGGAETNGNGDPFAVEPIYGKYYLPRKFKMAIALPEDNCIDLYSNDLGLLAIVENDSIVGYNIMVGGGMGVTPSADKTFPAVAKMMAYAPADKVVAACEAVVKVQRDFGNRSDRKIARLKYLIANWGIEKFKAKVEEYLGESLDPPRPEDVSKVDLHLGWQEQGDGNWFYGLRVENGRILDDDRIQLKSALREICGGIAPGIRLTAIQDMIFTDVKPEDKDKLTEILKKHHVPLSEDASTVRRWSMACVAWPTCGLSITEAERALPGVLDDLEVAINRLGLGDEEFSIHMTGCPNGCARPYSSDIGLVGKALGKYTLFVGGHKLGNRLNFIYKNMVPEEEVVSEIVTLLTFFKAERQPEESLGDFCHRQGLEALLAYAEAKSTAS